MNSGQLVTFNIRSNNLYSRYPGYKDSLDSSPIGMIIEACKNEKLLSFMVVWSDHPGKILAYSPEELCKI